MKDTPSRTLLFDFQEKFMLMTVEEKPAAENNEMQIVEVDEGLVEMTDKTADGGDSQRRKDKNKKGGGGKKKKEDIEEITIDSDSEEEEVAVVGADHL
jgi:hypothetical protein